MKYFLPGSQDEARGSSFFGPVRDTAGLSRRAFIQLASGAAALACAPALGGRRPVALGQPVVVPSSSAGWTSREFPFDGSIFPFGAIHFSTLPHWQHYLEPIPKWRPYLEQDLRQMKELGLNTVVAHIDWYDVEPVPGRYEFSRSDVVVELAEKLGLHALLWPWPELEPEWPGKAFPDSLWTADDGLKPGTACWDHPQVREAVGRFITATVDRYRSRRVVMGWDVAAEPGLWISGNSLIREHGQARTYCYCSYTKIRYREWLKKQYGDLSQLNQLWSTYYQRWDEIEPIRTGIFERAQALWVDWREFMLWNLADFQHFKADTARRGDPTRPITCHIGGVGSDYVYHCADEYQVTEFMDVVGLSFFPYWMMYGSGSYEPSWGALALDGVRSFGRGKPMWVEELQGGPSVYGMHYHSPEPQPDDIRLWVWQVIAHGGKGVHFWNWRPELTGIEASGFGMVAADGSVTPRAQAAGDLGKLLQRHAPRIMSAEAWLAEIAILHSPRTAILAFGEEEAGWPVQSERGVYRGLWRHQLPVDFIVTRQLAEGFDLSRYKIIYIPLAYTLSRAEGGRLRAFVANGGTLIGDLWCGLKDEHAFIYEQMPGAGLAEVFGCEMRELVPSTSSSVNLVNPEAFGSSLAAGTRFEVKRYRAKMTTNKGCSVAGVFEDGSPAVLVNAYEKGKAVYVPALLGLAFDEKPDESLARFLADLALWSGVRSPVQLESTPTQAFSECRLLRGEKEDVLFLLNHSDQPVSCQVRLPLARHRGSSLADLLSGEAVPARQESGSVVVDVKLDPKAVKVWLITLTDLRR